MEHFLKVCSASNSLGKPINSYFAQAINPIHGPNSRSGLNTTFPAPPGFPAIRYPCECYLAILNQDSTCPRLGGDILAGLTVASMLIPQSVSYATSLAKIPPTAGLVRNTFIDSITLLPSPFPLVRRIHTRHCIRLPWNISPTKRGPRSRSQFTSRPSS